MQVLEDSSDWDSKWDSLDPEKYTFVFDLSLNEASIQRGERYEINEWVTLNQQRIYIECAKIYPTHIRIYLQDDEQNTAWLKGMTYCLRDEHGSKTEQISDGLTATGSDTPFMPVLRNNSSFFWESEHLTPEITGAAWLREKSPICRL